MPARELPLIPKEALPSLQSLNIISTVRSYSITILLPSINYQVHLIDSVVLVHKFKELYGIKFEMSQRVEWSCIFIALLYTCHIHPFTHTCIHWWRRLSCKAPSAHKEEFGVQYLVQGHFDMQLGEPGFKPATLWLLDDPLFQLIYSHSKELKCTYWNCRGLQKTEKIKQVK